MVTARATCPVRARPVCCLHNLTAALRFKERFLERRISLCRGAACRFSHGRLLEVICLELSAAELKLSRMRRGVGAVCSKNSAVTPRRVFSAGKRQMGVEQGAHCRVRCSLQVSLFRVWSWKVFAQRRPGVYFMESAKGATTQVPRFGKNDSKYR